MTFLQWLDNFWYHYKVHTVIALFALAIVIVGSWQFFSREEHDVFIYVVGESGLAAADSDAFMNEMSEKFTTDKNGDGKKIVDMKIEKFIMTEDANGRKEVYNPNEQLTASERFNLELAAGECVVYIMQPDFFYANLDYLEDLQDAIGYLPENAVNKKGIALSDLPSYKATMTLSYFPEDYIICLADKENRIDDDYYEGNVEFFKNLIEFKYAE